MKPTITGIFLAALLLYGPYANGQGYYPLQVGDLWQYSEVPGEYWEVEVAGDTLMPNDTTYMVVTGFGGGFVRQSGPLVLAYDPTGNEERILYDFSKTTGDTVTIRYYPGDTVVVTVYSDQLEDHFGRTLRTWVVHETSTGSTYYAFFEVADSLGLVSAQAEGGFGYGLQGAIINDRQYGVILDVPNKNIQQPVSYALAQNYPNPFNSISNFEFRISNSSNVSLKIFNLLGEEVATLVSGQMDAGTHTVQWDATGQPSGVYFYRLEAGGRVETRKLVLLR